MFWLFLISRYYAYTPSLHSYTILSYCILLYNITSYSTVSYFVLPYHVLLDHTLSYFNPSYHILFHLTSIVLFDLVNVFSRLSLSLFYFGIILYFHIYCIISYMWFFAYKFGCDLIPLLVFLLLVIFNSLLWCDGEHFCIMHCVIGFCRAIQY